MPPKTITDITNKLTEHAVKLDFIGDTMCEIKEDITSMREASEEAHKELTERVGAVEWKMLIVVGVASPIFFFFLKELLERFFKL